jgi:hypothetical protein
MLDRPFLERWMDGEEEGETRERDACLLKKEQPIN